MRKIQCQMDMESAERYLMGDSLAEETAKLEEHLLVCEHCRAEISRIDAYLVSMSDAAGEIRARPAGPDESGWQLPKLLRAICAVAGLALLGMLAAGHY